MLSSRRAAAIRRRNSTTMPIDLFTVSLLSCMKNDTAAPRESCHSNIVFSTARGDLVDEGKPRAFG